MRATKIQTLALFGNRYSGLSRTFFLSLERLARFRKPSYRILLVDTSSVLEASIRNRVRNLLVGKVKQLLPRAPRTESLDWFNEQPAKSCLQYTSKDHNVNSASTIKWLTDHSTDGVIVAGCDQILRGELINGGFRIINYHNGLIPEYRGVGAVQWACLNGEDKYGYTFHTVESADIDLGRIVIRSEIDLDLTKNTSQLSTELNERATYGLRDVVDSLFNNVWPPSGRLISGGKYYSKKKLLEKQRYSPNRTADDLVRTQEILGAIKITTQVGSKIFSLAASEVKRADPRTKIFFFSSRFGYCVNGIAAKCLDGHIIFGKIYYVPSVFWLPIFALLCRKDNYS